MLLRGAIALAASVVGTSFRASCQKSPGLTILGSLLVSGKKCAIPIDIVKISSGWTPPAGIWPAGAHLYLGRCPAATMHEIHK